MAKKFESPIDIGALLSEVTNLNKAKDTPVSVSVYIDDSAADDVIAFVRNAYASAAANARISIAYLTNTDFVINDKDDFAVIVAGRDMRVGARAEELRLAGVPVMVVTTSPNLVEKVAVEQEHPIPKGDIVAPEVLTIKDSEAAEAIANLPIAASISAAAEYELEADAKQADSNDEVEAHVEEVIATPAEDASPEEAVSQLEDADGGTGADKIESPEAVPAEAEAGEGTKTEPAAVSSSTAMRAATSSRGLFGSLFGKASAVAGQLRKSAAAAVVAAAEPEPKNPFLVDVPEGLDSYVALNDEYTQWLSSRMGKWVIAACKDKSLSMALAFPFVRKPLADDIVNVTSVQNAGIGVAVFIPGADMPLMTLNQAKMILQIAAAYGEPMTVDRAKEIGAVVAGAFACRSAARQVAGVVPIVGWAVKGAIGYTGTLAMGKAAIEYFESGSGVAGVAGLAGKLTDAVQGAVAAARGDEPDEPEEQKDPLQTATAAAQRLGKFAGAAAGTAGPVAQAAAKSALSSFASGADSILASLSKKK